MESKNKSFRITDGKGFHLTFANNWTISVQFGSGNYCDNWNADALHADTKIIMDGKYQISLVESNDAEIAIWNPEGTMQDFDNGDTVKGRVSADELAQYILETQAR